MQHHLQSVLVAGSIGIDSITTPYAKAENFLGGSAIYSSLAVSFFAKPILLASAGIDLPTGSLELLEKAGVDHSNLLLEGNTFVWHGEYDYDGHVKTLKTEFDGVTDRFPQLPKPTPSYALVANFDPDKQLDLLKSLSDDCFTLADTIEFWIQTKREVVLEVFKKAKAISVTEGEAKQLAKSPNTITAGKFLLALGPDYVWVKKGEHGVLLFSKEGLFAVGGYPLENVIDPTGAGDSFAGALIGQIAKTGDISYNEVKQATVWAGAMASFTPEGIGPKHLLTITPDKLKERYHAITKLHQL